MVGPNWKGTLLSGVKATKPAPMPWIFVLSRILVDPTPADVAAVNKLQDQMRLEPLSQYLGKPASAARYVPPAPLDCASDPLADWKMINRALAESRPPAYEAQILEMFSQVGIGPGRTPRSRAMPSSAGSFARRKPVA